MWLLLVFTQPLSLKKDCWWLRQLLHGRGRVWATNFELGRDPFLEKRVLTSWERKRPKIVCHSAMHSRFWVFSRFGEQLVSCVFFLPRFWLCLLFSHGLEVVFVMPGPGLSSSRFWSCWCIFHSRFCDFMCFSPWLWRAIHVFGCLTDFWVSRTGYLGCFSLLWVGFPDKLQDCVFSPMLWAVFAVTYGVV